jgi:hypothetical protein
VFLLVAGSVVLFVADRAATQRRNWSAKPLGITDAVEETVTGHHPGGPSPGSTGDSPALGMETGELTTDSSEPLPAVYRGDFSLSGYVRHRDLSPVPGANVVCRPLAFHPLNERQYGALSTNTNADGYFALSELPRSTKYEIRAYTKTAFAQLRLKQQAACSKPIELIVGDLSYERLVFVDQDGKPVPVRDYFLHLATGAPLISSSRVKASWFDKHLAQDVGIDLPHQPHELVYVYRNMDVIVVRGKARPDVKRRNRRITAIYYPAETVTIPGYRPVTVSPLRRPMRDWPRAQEVILTPAKDGSLLRYEVEFPRIEWPEEWTEDTDRLDFSLCVVRGTPAYMQIVNRRRNAFRAERGIRFRLSIWDRGPRLSYDLEDKGTHILVKPHYPEMGFLDVIDNRQTSDRLNALVAMSIEDPEIEFYGNAVWPGYVRFGPLPVGEYQLWRYLFREGRGVYRGGGEMLGRIRVSKEPGSLELN